ncbi:hypothetical protein [Glaciimonas soli]|uniref:Uncharacterized protein n=1 Tax=Glaciimonas soli TaxID=2590999 RepID=A0A843YXY7_9BURK|nr:hypothetical protein [Glaciimonas soli]MQR02328.1 hypothetical protein [Glaciimonas soli]
MTNSVLAKLGEDAVHQSKNGQNLPCRANVERGVQMAGYGDDMIVERDVVTLSKDLLAVVGDTLIIGEDHYTLDHLFADNGYSVRYTLLANSLEN